MSRKTFRPGVSFGDFLVTDSSMRKSRIADTEPRDFRRGWLVWIGITVCFVLIFVRLATLQVFFGTRYRLLSDENRVKKITLEAPRGKIMDRNGKVLADNTAIKLKKEDGDEVEIWKRIYPLGSASAHVIGYLGQVSEQEVGLLKEKGNKYQTGEILGRGGIEAEYEESLRGQQGGRLVEVDHQGKGVRELGRKEASAGQDLKLTVMSELLTTGLEALKDKKGAIVASDPATGEVFAIVSSPSFDPNLFIDGAYGIEGNRKQGEIQQVLLDENLPMYNRAIGGLYPPGSTFKPVTMAAAITEGKVPGGFTFNDEGIIKVGTYSYTNWLFTKRGATEGVIGFNRALARSTDTFFYKVGEMTGPDNISKWGRKMGLASLTGIDIPGEIEGIMPDPDWKQKNKNESWYLGDTFIMSIGQGDILVTPIQVNLMTNIVATSGKKCPLRLVQNLRKTGTGECETVEIAKEALDQIHKGMIGACSEGGTAFPIFDWNTAAANNSSEGTFVKSLNGIHLPLIACKTGTAEYMTSSGKMKTHGWLTAYAPADDPKISVTVVVEGGGEGSNVAAPIVRKVMARYFELEDKYPYNAIPQEISE